MNNEYQNLISKNSETTDKLFGRIKNFHEDKNYGFVESESGEAFFFFFDLKEQISLKKSGKIDRIHKFKRGDTVEFKVRQSSRNVEEREAFDLIFRGNEPKERLLKESTEDSVYKGYLKQFNESFFVKHIDSYVFLPVRISEWETNLSSVYHDRQNQLVDFNISQEANFEKRTALLVDRQYCHEYYELCEIKSFFGTIEAKINGRNLSGFFATVLDGKIDAYIPIPQYPTKEEMEVYERIKKNDTVDTVIKKIFDFKKINLALKPPAI